MIARRTVWCDDAVEKLVERFVPAADEVWSLQHRNDPEGRLFQKIAEQGHYGGRTVPTNTRQGTYAATPTGILLASVNTNDPRRMAEMLESAIRKWETLAKEQRLMPEDPGARTAEISRSERLYPDGGLVLKVYSRDLPRENPPPDWRGNAWNQDFAWIRKEEALAMLPARLEPGAEGEAPAELVGRIARTCLQDNVRGQTTAYPPRALRRGFLITRIESVDGTRIKLLVVGKIGVEEQGVWPVSGYRDMNSPGSQRRGYEANLYGRATYDAAKSRFTEFNVVSLALRWGGTQYNGRTDDLAPAPIGHLLTLAGDGPADRVAPAHLGAYGWGR